MAEDDVKIKPSILSNISQANENVKNLEEKKIDIAKEQKSVLYSIDTAIKERNKKDVSSRTNERSKGKVFSRITELLTGIRENVKDKVKGMGIWQLILLGAAGVLFSIFVKFQVIGKFLLGAVKLLGKTVRSLGKGILKIFSMKFLKNTIFGKFVSKLKINFLKFVDFLGDVGKKLKKGFSIATKPFKTLGSFFGKGSKFAKVLGTIWKVLQRVFGFIGPILKVGSRFAKAIPVVGQIIAVITAVIDGFIGFFKAGSFFGKKKGESVTIGERFSAIIGSILSGITFGLLGSAKEWANKIYDIGEFLMKPITTIISGVKMLFTDPSQLGTQIVEWFKNTWSTAKTMFKDTLINLVGIGFIVSDWFKMKWEEGKQIFKDTLANISDFGQTFSEFGNNILNGIIDNIKNIFSSDTDGESALSKIKDGFMDFAVSIGTVISEFWVKVKKKASSIFGIDLLKDVVKKAREKFTDNKNKPPVTDVSTASLNFQTQPNGKNLEIKEKEISKTNEIKIKEQKQAPAEQISLSEGMSEVQRTKTLMNFLNNEFSTTMAKKIGAVMGKGENRRPEDVPVTPIVIK